MGAGSALYNIRDTHAHTHRGPRKLIFFSRERTARVRGRIESQEPIFRCTCANFDALMRLLVSFRKHLTNCRRSVYARDYARLPQCAFQGGDLIVASLIMTDAANCSKTCWCVNLWASAVQCLHHETGDYASYL